jgi:hypothetical protein
MTTSTASTRPRSGLRRLAGTSTTFDFKTVPTTAARLIDTDKIRIAANRGRRRGVGADTCSQMTGEKG